MVTSLYNLYFICTALYRQLTPLLAMVYMLICIIWTLPDKKRAREYDALHTKSYLPTRIYRLYRYIYIYMILKELIICTGLVQILQILQKTIYVVDSKQNRHIALCGLHNVHGPM